MLTIVCYNHVCFNHEEQGFLEDNGRRVVSFLAVLAEFGKASINSAEAEHLLLCHS